jgi:hypothetical protein
MKGKCTFLAAFEGSESLGIPYSEKAFRVTIVYADVSLFELSSVRDKLDNEERTSLGDTFQRIFSK